MVKLSVFFELIQIHQSKRYTKIQLFVDFNCQTNVKISDYSTLG